MDRDCQPTQHHCTATVGSLPCWGVVNCQAAHDPALCFPCPLFVWDFFRLYWTLPVEWPPNNEAEFEVIGVVSRRMQG